MPQNGMRTTHLIELELEVETPRLGIPGAAVQHVLDHSTVREALSEALDATITRLRVIDTPAPTLDYKYDG